MKSKDNKEKVQDELAKTFKEQISEHVDEIGAATATRVVDIWRDFRSAHAQALDLAERNPKFKAFLDCLKPQALPRLDEVVSLVLASEGEAGLVRRLSDGTLNTAVNTLPAPAMEIARETRSIDPGLNGPRSPATTCPRSSSSASTAAPLPTSSRKPRSSASSRSTTARRSCGWRASTAPRATCCSSSGRRPEEPRAQPDRGGADDAVALPDRAAARAARAGAARGGGEPGADAVARRPTACASPSSPAPTRRPPSP